MMLSSFLFLTTGYTADVIHSIPIQNPRTDTITSVGRVEYPFKVKDTAECVNFALSANSNSVSFLDVCSNLPKATFEIGNDEITLKTTYEIDGLKNADRYIPRSCFEAIKRRSEEIKSRVDNNGNHVAKWRYSNEEYVILWSDSEGFGVMNTATKEAVNNGLWLLYDGALNYEKYENLSEVEKALEGTTYSILRFNSAGDKTSDTEDKFESAAEEFVNVVSGLTGDSGSYGEVQENTPESAVFSSENTTV